MSLTRKMMIALMAGVLFGAAIYFGSLWLYEWSVAPPPQGHVDRLGPVVSHEHPPEVHSHVPPVEAKPDPRYIVVEALGLSFTEEAYHERVQLQIEREGYESICVSHLGTLALTARYLSVNSARQNLVYVEECARMEVDADNLPEGDTP